MNRLQMKGSSFVSQVMGKRAESFLIISKRIRIQIQIRLFANVVEKCDELHADYVSDVRVDFPAFFRSADILKFSLIGGLHSKIYQNFSVYIHHTSISKQSSLVDSISTIEQ